MATSISETILDEQNIQQASQSGKQRTILVEGKSRTIPYPFHSPADWRDCWIYFLMLDRFNNPDAKPKYSWNQRYGDRQGGTFKGVTEKLGYIKDLGARAIWLSPVLKNLQWEGSYHGYGIQDFLALDKRFASDGTLPAAEREFKELIDQAHARGIYVILDIILNHTARVFDYLMDGSTVPEFARPEIMNAPLGQEPKIEWIDHAGRPNPEWTDSITQGAAGADDAIWPSDLQIKEFFRRRGDKLSDTPPEDGFVRGDFGVLRQLVVEYNAEQPPQPGLLNNYGKYPVLDILIHIYQDLIAKYDIDGFRIDTVKYVAPDAIQTFGNAMREFALSIGKKNFFTFAEVYDQEKIINEFVGRHSASVDGFGLDAALDFPTNYKLPLAAKGLCPVEDVRRVFEDRKTAENSLISSHGEAGKYFVSFLDNHDQKERFNHPNSSREQVSLGLAALFCLQGIPCLYYGTEQGLQGTVDTNGNPDLGMSDQAVREALWGKPSAFDKNNPLYLQLQTLSNLRMSEPALRFGRIYFREVSTNGLDFGQSYGNGGLLAFSRVLFDHEILIIGNTSTSSEFNGQVLVDLDLNRQSVAMSMVYSNLGNTGQTTSRIINQAKFYCGSNLAGIGDTAVLDIRLAPMEMQIFAPLK